MAIVESPRLRWYAIDYYSPPHISQKQAKAGHIEAPATVTCDDLAYFFTSLTKTI